MEHAASLQEGDRVEVLPGVPLPPHMVLSGAQAQVLGVDWPTADDPAAWAILRFPGVGHWVHIDAAEQRRVHPDLRPKAALERPRGESDQPCQLADGAAGAAGFETGDRGLDGAGGSRGERAGERGAEARRADSDTHSPVRPSGSQ